MKKNLIYIFFLIILGVIFYPKITHFLFDSSWKTQEIIYESNSNYNERIEFQMKDIGALGYEKRIVRIKSGILFDDISIIDTSLVKKEKWKRVDKFVNELNLKFP